MGRPSSSVREYPVSRPAAALALTIVPVASIQKSASVDRSMANWVSARRSRSSCRLRSWMSSMPSTSVPKGRKRPMGSAAAVSTRWASPMSGKAMAHARTIASRPRPSSSNVGAARRAPLRRHHSATATPNTPVVRIDPTPAALPTPPTQMR